jgi:glycosyltransferase involved in cell wall biosynthesis
LSNPPQVSVIVPVFNSKATIQRAMDSVAGQTFTDFETIVVDDGSTDGSADIVTRCGGERITLIRHQQNRGAAAARNTAIAAAQGHWIAFLDSDDAWKPDKLARQLSVLKRSDRAIAACASGYYLHKDGRELTISLNIQPHKFRREILFGCTISPGTTLMVERRVFEEIGGFDEAFRRLEDWDWLLRYSERYQMAFVSEPLADIYLTTAKPQENGQTDPVLHAIHRIGMKYLPHLESWTRRLQLQSSLLVEHAANLSRQRRPIAAAIYVLAALCIYPLRNVAFFRTIWRSVRARLLR